LGLGTAAIFALAFSGTTTARADESGSHTQEQYECHYLNQCAGTVPPVNPSAGGNNVEYLQLGAGVLAGVGVVGAGLAAASRRRHGPAALPG
jgi:hypothetical protein